MQLTYDDALSAIDNEGTALGHKREVYYEEILLFHLAGQPVNQADSHVKGDSIGHVPPHALLRRVPNAVEKISELDNRDAIVLPQNISHDGVFTNHLTGHRRVFTTRKTECVLDEF